jgi:Uma2 family endonuclease
MNVELIVKVPKTRNPMAASFYSSNGKRISDKEFEDFCRNNPDLKVEQTAAGEIIIMPPTGGVTGNRNSALNGRLYKWTEKNSKKGLMFDSSTTFVLPNGAKRSPNLSWVKMERWNALTKEQQEAFPPLCPDFVVELRSKSDALKSLQAKMREYIENDAQLGWLIDPIKRKVHIYRPNTDVEILNEPTEVLGEPLLPKFVLKLNDLWQ